MRFKEGQFRQVFGYLRQKLSVRNTQALDAPGEIDDELWIILEYYSEVEEVGLSFLKQRGIKNISQRKKVFKHLQAYVRQAKNYYYSAKTLTARSSGLIYYYCFLNLVKAAIVIENPGIAGKKEYHGLEYSINKRDSFEKETVKIKKSGIFPKIYAWYFKRQINPQSLNISTLFSYCTDISYQCQLTNIYEPKIHPSYFAFCINKKEKVGWALLGIAGVNEILKFKKSFAFFFDNFEKIELPQSICREIFSIDAYNQRHFTFFQSINTKAWSSESVLSTTLEVRSEILKAFANVFQVNYFAKGSDFIISLPYKQRNQVRMDEAIAIYLVMYYLSNLVRYKPDYLEGLLSKREMWLIDSFVRSCPITFLRNMISRITGIDYILRRR